MMRNNSNIFYFHKIVFKICNHCIIRLTNDKKFIIA